MKIKLSRNILAAGSIPVYVGATVLLPQFLLTWFMLEAYLLLTAQNITIDLGNPVEDIYKESLRKQVLEHLTALEQGARWGRGARKQGCLEKLQLYADHGIILESARDLLEGHS